MSQESPTTDDPTEAIMRATYCALCKHGYADLTMQNIADESDRSKSALHYHYGSKHELLLAFLDHLFERFTARIDVDDDDDPVERLDEFVAALFGSSDGDDEAGEFGNAMMEIKAQAPYEDEFRRKLTEHDRYVVDAVREIIVDGVEAGQFRDVDVDETAAFFVTMIDGARTRRVTLGESSESIERRLRRYVEDQLFVEGIEWGEPTE